MTASASARPFPAAVGHGVSDRLSKKASRHVKERIIEGLLFSAAAFSVFVTIAMAMMLRAALSLRKWSTLAEDGSTGKSAGITIITAQGTPPETFFLARRLRSMAAVA